MSKYSRLRKNTLLVFIGNVGSKLIGIVLLPFYTKWLSVDDYGTSDIILIYVTFLLGIVTFCVSEAIFIFPKDKDEQIQKKYFSSGILFTFFGFIVTAIIFILSTYIFSYFDLKNTFTDYPSLIYFLIVGNFLQAYMQQFARSIGKVNIFAISGIVLTVGTALFSFLLIPKYQLMGFIMAQILALMLTATYSFVFSKAYRYLSLKEIEISSYKEMLTYSIPLIPNGIMWWLVGAMNRPIMEHYLGTHEVGIFAVANKFPSLISILFTVFTYSWQISVIEEFKKDGYKEFYNKVLRITFMILTLSSCLLAIFSKFLVNLLADEKFLDAWKYISIISLSVLLFSVSGFVGTNFSATRESKYYFYSSVWGAGASIVFNFLLIPSFGLFGTAIALVLSHAIMAIARIKYSWKHVQITNLSAYIIMLIINILLILLIYYTDSMIFKSIMIFFLFTALLFINRSPIKELIFDIKNLTHKFRH